jgi:hypothetical protein
MLSLPASLRSAVSTMPRVRENSLLGDDDHAKKIEIARKAKLPVHKLLAAVDNEELRGRLEAQWTNTAVLAAFIASISISCIFVDPNLDDTDPDYEAKKVVLSIFYVAATISSVCLLLATVILIENMTTLTLIPMRYVDDMLFSLGALEGIPSVLIFVALFLLLSLFPDYMFLLYGHGWEFYVTLIFTVVMTVFGIAYFVW